jgi:hypothetical protein
LTVLSKPPLHSVELELSNFRAYIVFSCPSRSFNSFPVFISHIFIILSSPALAKNCPSGENAILKTVPECRENNLKQSPVWTDLENQNIKVQFKMNK